MPTDNPTPHSSAKAGLDDSVIRAPRPSVRGGASTAALQSENKQIQSKKSAKPYDKAARPGTTATIETGSTTVKASSKQKAKSKMKPTTTNNKSTTGKENRVAQPPGTRKRAQAKSKSKPNAPDSENAPSSDTLVAPSSPCKPKVEEELHICTADHKKGAYTRSADVPHPSSPLPPSSLPPSSPTPAVPPEELPLSAFVSIRKSRRLLGLRAFPVPYGAPAELKSSLRSRSSSVGEDEPSRGARNDDEQPNNAESSASDGGSHDGDRLSADSRKHVLRLPDDMIREDGYAAREEWFDQKIAEYAQRWDVPIDVDDHDTTLAMASYASTIGSWTPTVSFLSSIAYSRSPCTTLSALFWENEHRKQTKDRSVCGECAERGEADARDCEGGGILGRRPGSSCSRADMGMDVEIGEPEELEDAPWCINGARVRYDGSVVGVCQVCSVIEASGSGYEARGDNGDGNSDLLGEVD